LYNNNITTPSQFVTHVVTEYGTADLAGKTPAQKAIAIIQIAAPRWRSYLMQQAVAQHLITPQEGQQINMVN
jgi:acyl-CoA hydrolase